MMNPESHAVGARFSAAAATYDQAATVQVSTARKLMSLLDADIRPARILDVGCGTGILSEMAARAFPDTAIHGIDMAPGLVAVATRRFANEPRISCRTASVSDIRDKEAYSLIVSNSSLHWITPLQGLFGDLAGMLAPGGLIAFSMMLKGTLRELHEARTAVLPHKPVRAQLPDIEEVRGALLAAGLTLDHEETDTVQVTAASARDFVRAIHDTGVTGGRFSHGDSLLTRGELGRLLEYYDTHYRTAGNAVYATYRVLYAVAGHS